jgi:glycosyltransferase involved in cell wall biosynthesis
MHILHITINPIDMERRILNQVDCAQKHQHNVSVIHLIPSGNVKKKSVPNFNSVAIRSPFFKGGPFKFIHFNWRVFVLAMRLPVNLIHVHDLWALPAATLVSKLRKIPLIYDAHEYYAGLEIFNRRKIRKAIWIQAEKACIPYLCGLITISEPLAQLYRDNYRLPCPVNVIRNLPAREQPDRSKAVNIVRRHDRKMLLYHGHFRPGRGLAAIIRACAQLNNIHLVLIGGGELEKSLRKMVSENQLDDFVDFIPYVETGRLISTAAQADIGIVLFEPTSVNYAHALPNKFFEYLMAGLPVLASNIDTLDYYVNKYHVGITVNPLDVNAIVTGIQQMLTDDRQLHKWRKNALKAAEELNWDKESEKLISLYKKGTQDPDNDSVCRQTG